MNVLSTHLDDLLAVLRSSADLELAAVPPTQLRAALARELDDSWPDLADRVRRLDEWHTEALSDFVAEAHVLAEALDRWPREKDGESPGETRVG
jgi:hypothetical protein